MLTVTFWYIFNNNLSKHYKTKTTASLYIINDYIDDIELKKASSDTHTNC